MFTISPSAKMFSTDVSKVSRSTFILFVFLSIVVGPLYCICSIAVKHIFTQLFGLEVIYNLNIDVFSKALYNMQIILKVTIRITNVNPNN